MLLLFIGYVSHSHAQYENTPDIAFEVLPDSSNWQKELGWSYNGFLYDVVTSEYFYSLNYHPKKNYLKRIFVAERNTAADTKFYNFNISEELESISYWTDPDTSFVFFSRENGLLTGMRIYFMDSTISTYYHEDGSTKEIHYSYHKDKFVDVMESYYESGVLAARCYFDGPKIVDFQAFTPDGELSPDSYIDEDGNGVWLQCYPEGGYCCECIIKKGKMKNCNPWVN